MAYKIIHVTHANKLKDHIYEIVCDTDADFADLPECATGSTAVSIESAAVRAVNASGEWAPFGGTAE